MNTDKLRNILSNITLETKHDRIRFTFVFEEDRLIAYAGNGSCVRAGWVPNPELRAFGVSFADVSYSIATQDFCPSSLRRLAGDLEDALAALDDALVRAHKEYGEPEPPVRTKYYHFRQNNSGGDFVFSDGISVHVIIEALSAEHANERAVECGLYFDGVSEGRDCSCCGDRWCKASEHDAEASPCIYGEPVGSPENIEWARMWAQGHPYAYVHHLDGRVESFI